ncbi:MAG: glycosyltransferase [Peptococcaceae bacterium]
MNYEKKVSICMMVKNEEKNLARCLESLKPLLATGLGELIIIDTGSEDATGEIARQYTPQVYEHPWTNNFSEMRNISISYARGEWIWIIDGDEEIENPAELVALFQRDLSPYNTLIITMKNYMKTPVPGQETPHNISILKRGFRNTPDFQFRGAVHNQPLAQEPSLVSNVILGHYGYMWENREFALKKFERTKGILEKELKKDPENIYYQFQLGVSWSNVDKYKALVEMRKAYELIRKLSAKKRVEFLYVHCIYARIAHQNKKYLETIEICKEGLEYSKDFIDLWYLAGVSLAAVNDSENALEYLQGFLKVKKYFHTTRISKDPSLTFYHLDAHSENTAYYQIALIKCRRQQYEEAMAYIEDMEPSDLKSQLILKISMDNGDYDLLRNYLAEIYDNEKIKAVFLKAMEKYNLRDTNKTALHQKIVAFYDALAGDAEPYYLLNKVRLNLTGEIPPPESFLDKLLSLPYTDLPDFYGDIIFYFLKEKVALSQFTRTGAVENLNRFLKYARGKYVDFDEIILAYLNLHQPEGQVAKLRYWIVLARHVLLAEKLTTAEYLDLFARYIDNGACYLRSIYHADTLAEEMIYDLKNDEQRFFLYLARAGEVKDNDPKLYIRYLRKALDTYPMKKGIEELLAGIKSKVRTENNEMDQLQKQFKNNIKVLIENGDFSEAEILIGQYEQIIAEDVEILLFKSQISLLKVEMGNNELLN